MAQAYLITRAAIQQPVTNRPYPNIFSVSGINSGMDCPTDKYHAYLERLITRFDRDFAKAPQFVQPMKDAFAKFAEEEVMNDPRSKVAFGISYNKASRTIMLSSVGFGSNNGKFIHYDNYKATIGEADFTDSWFIFDVMYDNGEVINEVTNVPEAITDEVSSYLNRFRQQTKSTNVAELAPLRRALDTNNTDL